MKKIFLLVSLQQMIRGAAVNITRPLPAVKWFDDKSYTLVKKDSSGTKTVLVDARTGKESAVPEKKEEAALKGSVREKDNDIYFVAADKSEKRLTNDKDKEVNYTLSPDGNYVAYTKKNNLFIADVNSAKEIQLTTDGGDNIYNGYAAWVYWEEIFGRGTRYRAFWWSPDSKHLAYMHFDETNVPVFPLYNATGQHGEIEKQHYPKAGDANPEVKTGIIDIATLKTTWADFNEKDDQYFGWPGWNAGGTALWLPWLNRGQDHLIVYAVDPVNGSKKPVYEETQKTWIDLDAQNRITYLSGNAGYILKSDKDGWENLYLYKMDGTLVNQVTTGNHWGTAIQYTDEKKKIIYFTARKENSARYDLYRVNFDGKNYKRLSFGDFTHNVQLSPGGSFFITTYSNASSPQKMAVLDNNGKFLRDLGDARGDDFDNYNFAKNELLRMKTPDGFDLPAYITWPLNFDKNKRYPVLISIYGGPNAGTVMDGWRFSGQSQWWAKEGLIQISIDHRASGHFGKNGINYMHRNLGKWEMNDYIEWAKWLRSQTWVDSARVCITGGSYGGYITSMALTYGADYFTHGIANSGVIDWQLYDTHYTEKFMDKPDENPEGYKNGSVITYAAKLKGVLRIVHGTMDDNVHIQNNIQFIDKLEELKKPFEMMFYPGGRHGWGGNKAIQQRNETTKFYYRYLLNKPVPAEMIN
jgi:dipeptidyl-peptidase-4